MWPQLVGQSVEFLRGLARKLTGTGRRTFQAEVAREVFPGNPRLTESMFGWGREAVRKGLAEALLYQRSLYLPMSRAANSGVRKSIRENWARHGDHPLKKHSTSIRQKSLSAVREAALLVALDAIR